MKEPIIGQLRVDQGYQVLLTVIALIAIQGCGHKQPTGLTVAIIDTSASMCQKQSRQNAWLALNRVIADCPAGSGFAAYPATANSEATADPAITVIADYDPFTTNKDQYEQALESSKAGARRSVKSLLSKTSNGTDLLHTIRVAGDLFNGEKYRHAKIKRLVMVTDGINQVPDCDFLSMSLTPAEDDKVIAALRAQGALPRLDGVTVWMAGAASGESNVSPVKQAQIRVFWIRLFKSCGASLSETRYGAGLLNFPEG